MKSILTLYIVSILLSSILFGQSHFFLLGHATSNPSTQTTIVKSTQEQKKALLRSSVSPNPARQNVTVSLQQDIPSALGNSYELDVFDMIGNHVACYNNKTPIFHFSVEELPTGMYFYFINKDNQRESTGRLIVRR